MALMVPFDPSDDRDNFHLLMGRAIRAFADMESQLWLVAAILLGVDEFRARIVMGSISNGRAQRELIVRLAETYMDESILPKFRSLIRRMTNLSGDRNLLAHASFSIKVKGSETLSFRDIFKDGETRGLAFEFAKFPPSRVKTLLLSAERLGHDLTIFLADEVPGKVHRLARIHRKQPADPTP